MFYGHSKASPPTYIISRTKFDDGDNYDNDNDDNTCAIFSGISQYLPCCQDIMFHALSKQMLQVFEFFFLLLEMSIYLSYKSNFQTHLYIKRNKTKNIHAMP